MRFEFLNVCNDVTKTATKIPQSEYLSKGLYPIYDQGKDVVGGYSNCNDGIANDYPYICFGDHTRVIKYIDSPCFIGADGVKLLKVMNNNFLPKYVYYSMVANPVDSQGYSRHYKLLKETTINYVDRVIQSKIIDELDNLNNIIRTKKDELLLHDELIKSRFIEMFDSERNKEKLVNLCQFINGDRGKNYPSANDRTVSGVPFINAGHLDNNTVCFEKMEYISEQKYELLSSGKVQKDDIIYCLRGSLGKKGIVTFDKGAIASSLLILRANSKIRPLFLLYSLEQEYILSQMKASNNGSSQPNLSAQSVKQYDVILPTISRQIEIYRSARDKRFARIVR